MDQSAEKSNPLAQPKGFYYIWVNSLIGNFSAYLFYSVFVVFFIDILHVSQSRVAIFFGAFQAIGYGLAPIGGWLSDHVFGAIKAIYIGSTFGTFGNVVLTTGIFTNKVWMIMLGFAMQLVGGGTIRVNGSKILSYMYKAHRNKADAGFTMYYASVNVGSFLALLVAPAIRTSSPTVHIGYMIIFAINLVFGLVAYSINLYALPKWSKIVPEKERKVLGKKKIWACIAGFPLATVGIYYLLNYVDVSNIIFYLIATVIFIIFFIELSKEKGDSRKRMWVSLAMIVEGILFYVLYTQMGTSMNFYAINNASKAYLFGHLIPPLAYQAFNPFWIMVLSPFLALYYNKSSRGTKKPLPLPYKFSIGMTFSFVAFLTLAVSAHFANTQSQVGMSWFAVANLFQSTAELLIGALGLSMVMKYSPARVFGLVTGIWYMALSVANILGGEIASLTGLKNGQVLAPAVSLAQYQRYFYILSAAIGVAAILMYSFSPLLTKLSQLKAGGDENAVAEGAN